jgi:hypothetical protein
MQAAPHIRVSDATGLLDFSQSAPFLDAIGRYVDPRAWFALRAFPHARGLPAAWRVDVRIGDTAAVLAALARGMHFAASATEPLVFSPATGCTFVRPGTAKTRDIAEGLALVVEIDQGDTAAAVARLETLLGQPTAVVRSGGWWTDPETGEVHPKLHVYWRLSEPTRCEPDHILLYAARRDAALLAGADPTGAAVAHCYRWPGSVNRKYPDRPARCTLDQLNPGAEIHLVEAAELLAEAAHGIARPRRSNGNGHDTPRELTADPALVASAMAVIPNGDVHYDEWVRWGYAVCGATAGQRPDIWHDWSAKSAKHHDAETAAAWRRIVAAGVTRIGAGSIFAEAKAHGWRLPSAVDRLWHECTPLADTAGGSWLVAIGLGHLIACAELRFHAACPYPGGPRRPAIVAALRDIGGVLIGLHRVYIHTDGTGLADCSPQRASLGHIQGGAIRLSSIEDLSAAGEVVVAIDLEEAASLGLLMDRPAWAAATPANLAAGIVLPPQVQHVVIADVGDDGAAYAAWHRFKGEGRAVRTATPADDAAGFNQMLLGDGHG